MNAKIRFFALLLCFAAAGCGKESQPSAQKEPASSGHVEAALLSEVDSVQPGRPFWTGIRLEMKDGWHTYWKNPGDSGMATKVLWTLPAGFKAGSLKWPSPERFHDSAGVTYGYSSRALLLAQIVPPEKMEAGQTVTISADVRWLECKDVCVPGKSAVSLSLPVRAETPGIDPRNAGIFSEARSKVPAADLKKSSSKQ